ncbi:MAG: periplasmic heavy metal sensor [Acidobacteria bacterium]|nr:periplasmic heavy metal sensor [Acidobacteriota bacterium]
MKTKILFLSLAVGAVFAQGPMGPGRMGPGGPQPKLDEVKAMLNLTDGQIVQIQAAQKQAMDKVSAVRTQLFEKSKALRDLRAKGSPDAAALGKLTQEIDALRKQIQDAREAGQKAAVNLLTGEQKAKLAALEAAAKLRPAIQEAMALGLLTPPDAPAAGMRGGLGGMGSGPGGMGMEMHGRRAAPNR